MTGCLSIRVCASLAVGQIVILTFVCFTSQTVNTPKQRYPHFSAAAHCQPLFRFPSAAYQQTQHTSAVTQNNRRTFLLPTPTGQHFRECVQGREAATVRVSCSPTSAGNDRTVLLQEAQIFAILSHACIMHMWNTSGLFVMHVDTVKHREYSFFEAFKINYSSCLSLRFSVQGTTGTNNHFL